MVALTVTGEVDDFIFGILGIFLIQMGEMVFESCPWGFLLIRVKSRVCAVRTVEQSKIWSCCLLGFSKSESERTLLGLTALNSGPVGSESCWKYPVTVVNL